MLLLACFTAALCGLAFLIYSFISEVFPAGLPSRVPNLMERRLKPFRAARGRTFVTCKALPSVPQADMRPFFLSVRTVYLLFACVPQTASQLVTTLAGGNFTGTTSGFVNGIGSNALFFSPNGVAVDSSGIVYVADTGNHKIRAIYPNQTVITLAGGSTTGTASGSVDGFGTNALFLSPNGVAVDSSGIEYVADTGNHKIRIIYPNQTVITLAGGSTTGTASGSVDGFGINALFLSPTGVAVDSSGIVYVADWYNHKIRTIHPNRTVSTLAGGSSSGSVNGVGTNARFFYPYGVAVDFLGMVYVADINNNKIRAIYPNQTVFTLAGGSTSGTTSGSVNGVGTNALFLYPYGIAADSSGMVYVADISNHKIRAIYPNQTVITLAGGSATGTTSGSFDGIGTNALFISPRGVSVDSAGIVIVADTNNHKIRKIFPFLCAPGTFADFTVRRCVMCFPGFFSNTSTVASSCLQCPPGTFTPATGSTSCQQCPGGHYCPAGTSSWARLNCGRGNFCPDGSGAPTPCPFQVPPTGGWGALQVQGPAFLVDTAYCLNHCFWNFTSGDGMLSKC